MADKPKQLHLTGIPLRSIPAGEQSFNSGIQGFHPVLIEQIEHGVLNAFESCRDKGNRSPFATRPRSTQVSLADTPYYHCVARCGIDHITGENYEHRREWLVDKLKSLASIFSMDICAYAVMSNHYQILGVLPIQNKKAPNLSTTSAASR